MKLIGVYWGEDRGVVDMDTKQVIMYCHGEIEGGTFNIPTVYLEDEDFQPLVPAGDEGDEALFDYANWNNVCELLLSPDFNLETRLTHPEEND